MIIYMDMNTDGGILMSMIVSVDWLHEMLSSDEQIVVVDVRYELGDPGAGRKAYEKEHILQAVYLDLSEDLAGPVEKHGGENPLPDVNVLAQKLGSLGIDQETTVVIYDTANDMFASRAWWIFHYIGHDRVFILDGGLTAWKEAGLEVTAAIPSLSKKHYEPKVRPNLFIEITEVKEKLKSNEAILLDSRSYERYIGKTEPLYHKAGHIPGAKNFFYQDVFNEDGTWKNEDQLRETFSALKRDDELIVSCGSGVSACVNIIGLKRAGYKNVKLYPGSFSDWISYEENELETREE